MINYMDIGTRIMSVSEKNLEQFYLSSLHLTPENTHAFWGVIFIIYYCQEEMIFENEALKYIFTREWHRICISYLGYCSR